MKIGITYDTKEMYSMETTKDIYYDFAEECSITDIKKQLKKLEYDVQLIGNVEALNSLIKEGTLNCDLIYNTNEGISSRNRESYIPAILEANHIPYMGTDAFGLALSLNKYLLKIIAQFYGIDTPDYVLIQYNKKTEYSFEELKKLKFPIIIKPNFEGNSSGIKVCQTLEEAQVFLKTALSQYQSDVLCEEFIFGKEITVPVIGNDPESLMWGITTVDVQKDDSFWLDLNWKTNGDYKNILLSLPEEVQNNFHHIICQLYRIIGVCDFCRFDFRLTSDYKIYFIEANPLPALFRGGSFDVLGQSYGYSYGETLDFIIKTTCKRLFPKTEFSKKSF